MWLDSPTALLSGLTPAKAILDPSTAARARQATRRLITMLAPKVPDLVSLLSARVVQPGTTLVLLEFDDGARRVIDLRPYLWGAGFDNVRNSYTTFMEFRVDGGALAWPSGIDLSPRLLYGESWPAPEATTPASDEP
ncbi:DUF2442 domain-containing protein [Nocardioides sp.]|uniref:DUF2442 domain-containing protein n=1 Tax=Nocardioides sp. TaxID=35761 RepID=UPI0035B49294